MKNDWEKKATCSAYLSSKIFAISAWVWTRSTSFGSFQRCNWSPTYILHLFHLGDTALLFLFLSLNRPNSTFFHAFTLSLSTCCLLFLNSVHAQYGFTWKVIWLEAGLNCLNWILVILDNNSNSDSFGSFLSKKEHKSDLLQHNCSFYEGQYGKRQ